MTTALIETYGVNLDEAAVGPVELPEAPDGATWAKRRHRIVELFGTHVFGSSPPLDVDVAEEHVTTEDDDGVTVRESRLVLSRTGRAHAVDLLVLAPPRVRAVVVVLNFEGNATVLADADRGGAWPRRLLADAGIALATVHAGALAPDDPDRGAEALTATLALPTAEAPMGTIGAWAWGLRAVARHLRGLPEVDGAPLIALGHSRMGKAALWAAAQDDVFDAVVSNESGCGGAALLRRNLGENIAAITDRFPHWFTPAFATYAGREADLPVDAHLLLAALAPRPVHVGSAADDLWADPTGEHAAVVAAASLYRDGGGRALGYHLRPGGHALTAEDWGHYVAFVHAHVARA